MGQGNSHSTTNRPNPTLPVNHIRVLHFSTTEHTDIVRHLVAVGDARFVSAGDDGRLVLHDVASSSAVTLQKAHTRAISSLVALTPSLLISGAADHRVRLWDLETRRPAATTHTHTGCVVAITPLRNGDNFVSVCADQRLCVWDKAGVLLFAMTMDASQDDLHAVLALEDHRLVVASDSRAESSIMLVYNLQHRNVEQVLPACHRESIHHVARLSPRRFASASTDGVVAIWRDMPSTARARVRLLRTVNYHQEYQDRQLNLMLFQVTRLLPLSEQLLVVAIGRGFAIYDVLAEDVNASSPVLECADAHECAITDMIVLFRGSCLVTCAIDGCVSFWYIGQPAAASGTPPRDKSTKKTARRGLVRRDDIHMESIHAHSGSVQRLLKLGEDKFASAGSDGVVITWRDERAVDFVLDEIAALSLDEYEAEQHAAEADPQDPSHAIMSPLVSAESIARADGAHSARRSARRRRRKQNRTENTANAPPPFSLSEDARADEDSGGERAHDKSRSETLARQAWELAEKLRVEKQLPVQVISFQLRARGFDDTLIVQIADRQRSALSSDTP